MSLCKDSRCSYRWVCTGPLLDHGNRVDSMELHWRREGSIRTPRGPCRLSSWMPAPRHLGSFGAPVLVRDDQRLDSRIAMRWLRPRTFGLYSSKCLASGTMVPGCLTFSAAPLLVHNSVRSYCLYRVALAQDRKADLPAPEIRSRCVSTLAVSP